MPHRYRVTVEHLSGPGEKAPAEGTLRFEITNHDDLFAIVDRVQASGLLRDGEVAEFAIGLKMFGEVMLRHRQDQPFEELWPHLGTFMRRLKGQG